MRCECECFHQALPHISTFADTQPRTFGPMIMNMFW